MFQDSDQTLRVIEAQRRLMRAGTAMPITRPLPVRVGRRRHTVARPLCTDPTCPCQQSPQGHS